ncbi:response regulator [candidate division CSSED10-310 bacterium]|uniref:histidine kinase n=1 Tax=candidate division CSSED10-310 bacterium TaxID=2855610 RepID=A0ABV6YX14_UNCC1
MISKTLNHTNSDFSLSHLTQPHILCIDDDPGILQSLGKILRTSGYTVSCLSESTGIENLVQEHEFDLVITDLKMTGNNGLDVLKTFKVHQPQTPVVILTGYATLESAIEALEEGAYKYLVKPCNIKEMQMTVEHGIKQKRIRLERDHLYHKLQEKNMELEIAMTRLVDTHAQLKDSEDFRENIVSMFTHDLLNPVTSIKGFLNIMMREPEAMDQLHKQYLTIIQRNINKIELLLKMFHTFYKIDKQSYEMAPKFMDLCASVRESINNVDLFAKEQNLKIKATLPSKPVNLHGDPFELERAVTNILYNAIKYSPTNSTIEIAVSTTNVTPVTADQTTAEKPSAVVTIQDFGIGIEIDEQEKIFHKMYRGTNARDFKGTGVGLYISKFIINLHGGEITVQSEPGKGSLFTIYLPLLTRGK